MFVGPDRVATCDVAAVGPGPFFDTNLGAMVLRSSIPGMAQAIKSTCAPGRPALPLMRDDPSARNTNDMRAPNLQKTSENKVDRARCVVRAAHGVLKWK